MLNVKWLGVRGVFGVFVLHLKVCFVNWIWYNTKNRVLIKNLVNVVRLKLKNNKV